MGRRVRERGVHVTGLGFAASQAPRRATHTGRELLTAFIRVSPDQNYVKNMFHE